MNPDISWPGRPPAARRNTPPRNAYYVSSRVARYAPDEATRRKEREAERALDAFIASQPYTRYQVTHKPSGSTRIQTLSAVQLLGIWPDAVITAADFLRRWSARELQRLLDDWNRQDTAWRYTAA